MVDLVRSGRTPEALSREFEPTAQAIWNWVRQADRDEGRRQDGPTSAEREELTRLRRENRQLVEQAEIIDAGRYCPASRPLFFCIRRIRAKERYTRKSGNSIRCRNAISDRWRRRTQAFLSIWVMEFGSCLNYRDDEDRRCWVA